MDGHPLRNTRPFFCMPHDGPDGTGGNGPACSRPREEPRYGPIGPQIGDEQFEGRRREDGVTIFAALTLSDGHRHAGTIDVAYREMGHLADAKARSVGYREYGLVLEVVRDGEESPHFPLLEDDGHLHRPLRAGYLLHLPRPFQGDGVNEFQSTVRHVEHPVRGVLVPHEVEEILPHLLLSELVRELSEVAGKMRHPHEVR